MSERRKAFRAAWPKTIPVLTGYLFLGIAFGVLLNAKGYGVGWALLMSTFIYAGSLQYVAVTFLAAAFHPMAAFLMTLMINARHIFYGLSMLDKFKYTGGFKPYLIFGLTDETFSVLCGPVDESVSKSWYMFWVTLLNHSYWIAGSVAGSLLGELTTFNTKGLDFVLTALFVVIFTSQWQEAKEHRPAILGIGITLVCRILFGSGSFLIPAMLVILICLAGMKKTLGKGRME